MYWLVVVSIWTELPVAGIIFSVCSAKDMDLVSTIKSHSENAIVANFALNVSSFIDNETYRHVYRSLASESKQAWQEQVAQN